MSKSVRRITVVTREGGRRNAATVYKSGKKKKKKVAAWLRPADRLMRNAVRASERWGSELERRRRKSSRKRRNGAIRDAPINMMRANEKALRKLIRL